MFDYFTKKILPCEFLVKDRYYAVQLGDDWYRCKILSIDHREAAASCFLIDLGIEDAFPIKSYYELPPQFLKLPAQVLLFHIKLIIMF